jgi:hypothetical protein
MVADTIRRIVAPFPLNVSSVVIDILVAAILKACKRDKQSEELLKALLWTSLFSLIGFAIGGILTNNEKPRKRKKPRK